MHCRATAAAAAAAQLLFASPRRPQPVLVVVVVVLVVLVLVLVVTKVVVVAMVVVVAVVMVMVAEFMVVVLTVVLMVMVVATVSVAVGHKGRQGSKCRRRNGKHRDRRAGFTSISHKRNKYRNVSDTTRKHGVSANSGLSLSPFLFCISTGRSSTARCGSVREPLDSKQQRRFSLRLVEVPGHQAGWSILPKAAAAGKQVLPLG